MLQIVQGKLQRARMHKESRNGIRMWGTLDVLLVESGTIVELESDEALPATDRHPSSIITEEIW